MSVPSMLFCRHYERFFGGHLKHAHYVAHTAQHNGYQPALFFTAESHLPVGHPWEACADRIIPDLAIEQRAAVFVAGQDWLLLDKLVPGWDVGSRPVINLIQHVRHAEPANEQLFAQLSRPAIRLCVSEQVQQAIEATGRVNGPVLTINNGTDLPLSNEDALAARTAAEQQEGLSVVLVGYKRPVLARQLAGTLAQRGITVTLLDELLPREQFTETLSQHSLAVFLPRETEGFYLPALEAMALGVLVICPDVVGNRSFCLPERNCLQPAYQEATIADAASELLAYNASQRLQLRKEALSVAEKYTLSAERQQYHQVLDRLPELWATCL